MSQQEILKILKDLGGKATIGDIRSEANERFPEKTLSSYANKRLNALERQGIVKETTIDNKAGWQISSEDIQDFLGEKTVENLGANVKECDLSKEGISIRNLVGYFEIGHQVDLNSLAVNISNAKYHSETHSNLIYRSPDYESLTILVPASGRVTVVGAKNKNELEKGTKKFVQTLEDAGIEIEDCLPEIRIQNIVGTTELNREIDLRAVSLDIGIENIEYNPEKFPGLVYRKPNSPVILLFSSGKIVFTGAKSYGELLNASEVIREEIRSLFENDN